MLKRCFDLCAAALLLAGCLPLLAVLALLICCESPGPAIFRQRRVGRDFVPFEIFKLRTMRGVAGAPLTLGKDPRITRLGAWLRRTKLDELPQLWNVLRGEMSLVGPRPVIPALVEEFHSEYSLLLRVRPGLTDPATLQYAHETELLQCSRRPMELFHQIITPRKLQISLEYLQQASFGRDLRLLLQTAAVILRRKPIAAEELPSMVLPTLLASEESYEKKPPMRVDVPLEVLIAVARNNSQIRLFQENHRQ